MKVRFRVVGSNESVADRNVVLLRQSTWDDWFKYETLFVVDYIDDSGDAHHLGSTKIGKFGLQPASDAAEFKDGFRYPCPPQDFERLDSKFFSLGQDADFYESLQEIGSNFRQAVLTGLRDIAYDKRLLARAEKERVTQVSLLRSVPLPTVQGQLHRLAHGGQRLTNYRLAFRIGTDDTDDSRPQVTFAVEPRSSPPTNIHVLIGRNGVGKSTFLNNLAEQLVNADRKTRANSKWALDAEGDTGISNIVSVSFSAFDAFEPLPERQDRTDGLTYHYVGLRKKDKPDELKGPPQLAGEMTRSAKLCVQGSRRERWLQGLRLLEADPIFADTGIADAVDNDDDAEILETVKRTFKRLSSGHKIVLLTITKLVETVEEKSLVLLDEPEAHLHPPLLSAFIRALSDLLVARNGVAIIATHSPVVLQEVPRTCAWKLGRSGPVTTVERPLLETFGENVGVLTNEVFGLEVKSTGFHRLLSEVAEASDDYATALGDIGGQLGTEGKAILRAMIHARKQ